MGGGGEEALLAQSPAVAGQEERNSGALSSWLEPFQALEQPQP